MSYNQPIGDTSLIACLHCDLLQRIPELEPGASARCPRCNKELWRHRVDSLNRTFALTLGALLLYVIANSVPMLGLTIVGRDASTTVIGGALHLWDNGQKIVGVLVLFTAVIAPALQIGLMLAIVLGGMRARPPQWVGTLLRYHPTTRIWSMIEVMMVGVLVALVKIADYATVIPGLALFVLWILVFVLAGMSASFDSRDVWDRIQWADEAQRDAARPAELRRLWLALAPRAGRARRTLPPMRRETRVSKVRQLPADVGVPYRCCGLLHPGECASRTDDHNGGGRGFRHYSTRSGVAVVADGMAAVDHRARRQHHDPEREDPGARLPANHDPARLRREQRAADSYV
jgi:paraquat-inducible protein A